MLVYGCILLCTLCALTDGQQHSTIVQIQNTLQKDSKIQNVVPRIRSKANKLTFRTLYPQFMSTWSNLKLDEKEKQVSVRKKKEGRTQYLSTKKVNRFEKPTTIKTNSVHKAFIEVETMRPYVPRRNTMSRRTLKRKITRIGQNKPTRFISTPALTSHKLSNFLKDQIKRKRILTAVPTSYPLKKLNSLKPETLLSQNYTNNISTNEKQVLSRLQRLETDLNQIRSVVKNGTKVISNLKSEVQTTSVENAKVDIKNFDSIKTRMNSNGNINGAKTLVFAPFLSLDRNENKQDKNTVNQRRMEWLRQKLSGKPNQVGNYRRNKNSDDVNNKDEGKEDNDYLTDEFKETHVEMPNILLNKSQKSMNETGNGGSNAKIDIRHLHKITKDPLAYDSFDLQLEHESNIQEIARLKNVNAIPTFKSYIDKKSTKRSTTAKRDADSNFPSSYIDNGRPRSFLFAPPPGLNETSLKSIKDKKNDEKIFNDVLAKILSGSSDNLKNTFVLDNTENLGKKMLERLDLPGMKNNFDVTVSNKDFDHVKYVDTVMRQSSLPLSERRNIVKKSVDARLNELYEKYNLKPVQTTKDDLDSLLKSIGATLHK